MSRLTQLALFVGVVIFGLPVLAGPIHVPHPAGEAVRFTPASDTGDLTAQGGDGARIVVGETAVITGAGGSRLALRSEHAAEGNDVTLLGGGFHLHVGSKPITLELGSVSLEARSAEIVALEGRTGWIIQVTTLFGDGSVVMHGQEETAIIKSEALRITAETPPAKAPQGDESALDKLRAKLTNRVPRGKIITRDVEDPADLVTAGQTAELDQLEIEGIEVEVDTDCVEICVD